MTKPQTTTDTTLRQIALDMGVMLTDYDIEQIRQFYSALLSSRAALRALELYIDGH